MGCGWWVDRSRLCTDHRLDTLRMKEEWASQRDNLIRMHQAEKLLLSLERKEIETLLDIEDRKADR